MRRTTPSWTRRCICVIALGAAVLAAAASSASAGPAAGRAAHSPTSFWVAPGGSDAWPGTAGKPFATLQRARDAVRALPAGVRHSHDITVFVRGGHYRLSRPLVLEPQDSGRGGHEVVYRAAPGEHPVLSASMEVPNGAWSPWRDGVWRAQVGQVESRQLYVDGVRATRARTTAWPAGFRPEWNGGGAGSGIAFIPAIAQGLTPPAWGDPATWTNVDRIEAVLQTQWKMMSVPVASVSPSSGSTPGLITMQQPAWKNANVFLDATTNQPGIWSFWQVTWFENALQFLDQPGEWYLDQDAGYLYYIPRPGEDLLHTADAELPLGQTLVAGRGRQGHPVTDLRFEGLDFAYATWLQPSGPNGYVSDQSGFHLVGEGYQPNIIGHVQGDVRTPGNVSFSYGRRITFRGNVFEHLGAAALDLVTGCQDCVVEDNLFTDVSSAAVQLGGISPVEAHPTRADQVTRDNVVRDNLISTVGVEFVDAAGIYVGFTRHSLITGNTIVNVPWSGIAVGWGWGLLDPSGYPGIPGATKAMWGTFSRPTPNRDCVIRGNRIDRFLQVLWDGGAVYTTGQQGTSAKDGLVIEGNVASGKGIIARADGSLGISGGNTFYTDGGSRYITLRGNVSFDDPVGTIYLGPPPKANDPLPYPSLPSAGNLMPYGSDLGGCRTYGDIRFVGNTWLQDPFLENVGLYNALYKPALGFAAYSDQGFFDIGQYTDAEGVSYPTNLTYVGNRIMPGSASDLTQSLSRRLTAAGVQGRPATIPAALWTTAARGL